MLSAAMNRPLALLWQTKLGRAPWASAVPHSTHLETPSSSSEAQEPLQKVMRLPGAAGMKQPQALGFRLLMSMVSRCPRRAMTCRTVCGPSPSEGNEV